MVARAMLDQRELLGGSAYFAASALLTQSADVYLATNTGNSERLRSQLSNELPGVHLYDERTGEASQYLSVWDLRGGKQLYVRSASDPTQAAIVAMKARPEDVVLALSLRDPASYDKLIEPNAKRRLFVVPNQTLVGAQSTFARLAKNATAVVLNEREAFETTGTKSMKAVEHWLEHHASSSTVVVTHAGSALTVLRPGSPVLRLDLTGDVDHRFVLGGGDTFAAFASIFWADELPELGLQVAAVAAEGALNADHLFDYPPHVVDQVD